MDGGWLVRQLGGVMMGDDRSETTMIDLHQPKVSCLIFAFVRNKAIYGLSNRSVECVLFIVISLCLGWLRPLRRDEAP